MSAEGKARRKRGKESRARLGGKGGNEGVGDVNESSDNELNIMGSHRTKRSE